MIPDPTGSGRQPRPAAALGFPIQDDPDWAHRLAENVDEKSTTVAPDMTQPDICAQYAAGPRTTVSGLTRLTSVVAASDALYISNRGNSAGIGQVISD